MNRYLLPTLLVALVAGSAQATSNEIGWKKGYEVATSEAKASGKLVMIDFYTDWCVWCKKLDSDTYPAPAVVAQSEKFIPIKLNAEKDADGIRLAKKFKVDGYPTILFLDGDENLVYKIVGYSPPKEFAANMAKASTIRADKAKYVAALKTNPNDFSALIGLSGIDASMGDVPAAAALLDTAGKNAVPAGSKGKLLDAYNAVGDGYQNSQQFPEAIVYFKKAIDPAFPDQTAYAQISLAVCYASTGDVNAAKPYLQAILDSKNAPDEYRSQAKQMLDSIAKIKKS